MKFIFVSILGVAISSVAAKETNAFPATTDTMTGDFITGFETGIFLRKADDQYNEYKCPEAEVKI